MDDWIAAVSEALGLDTTVDVDLILDVAKQAARAVRRPAAPTTTYLMGMAVARGADPDAVAARITELAAGWSTEG